MVGYAYDTSNLRRAFRWTAWGGMKDLNRTYASLTEGLLLARGKSGQPRRTNIVGYGVNAVTGRTEGYLLDTAAS